MAPQGSYAPVGGTRPMYGRGDSNYGSQTYLNDKAYGTGQYDSYGLSNNFRPPKKSGKKKWFIIGGVILVLAIAGGVVGGVLATRHNSSSSGSKGSSAASSSNGSSTTATSGSPTSVSGDPSQFTKDSRLHQSFYAMAYSTPNGAMYPTCGDTIETILPQVQLMSQVTSRLRLYGMDCQQAELVLAAIQQAKVNMSVYLGVYMDADESIYTRQVATLLSVLKTYGTANVLGVTVGNEYILGQSSNGAAAQAAAIALVLKNVADTKRQLQAAGYNIPVGSGDAGSMVTAAYAKGLDFLFSNNHPFFAGTTIQASPGWAVSYLESGDPSVAATALPRNKIWQGEIGWPTNAIAGGSLSLNGSVASIPNLQFFLDNWVCQANQNLTTNPSTTNPSSTALSDLCSCPCRAFDSRYNLRYNGSEPFWGLWDWNNNLKPVTIPNCQSP